MDIPDIDLVVVYDLPSTLTQLYQVYIIFHYVLKCEFLIILFSSFVVELDVLETVRGLIFFLHIKRRITRTNGFRNMWNVGRIVGEKYCCVVWVEGFQIQME